ncbi:hypothetical protein PV326_001249, partial [Microctonus aethiopoides]
ILAMDEGAKFALIVFIEDPGQLKIDIVPTNWIYYNETNDKLYCPFIDVCNEHNVELLNSLVKRRPSPLSTWKSYAIDIRGTANTYKEATKKVEKLISQPYVFSTEDEEHALQRAIEIKRFYKMKTIVKEKCCDEQFESVIVELKPSIPKQRT